jgi:hypothetical protein
MRLTRRVREYPNNVRKRRLLLYRMQICEVRHVTYRLCRSHAFGTRETQMSLATPLTERVVLSKSLWVLKIRIVSSKYCQMLAFT